MASIDGIASDESKKTSVVDKKKPTGVGLLGALLTLAVLAVVLPVSIHAILEIAKWSWGLID
jgi:hypothetical protein